ncbi:MULTISPECIES: CDP-glycerol glycerophosphotransferase family protein [Brevibacillus]|jgi:hypothetical protein|uniref:CDP-glycerol glycerophosphotransferase family protein n=1 Tax=Brevibacillus TaxID=55080 RepID=UPI001FAA1EBC|nr:CDP-glycerol glycerophosphotransferase family protein [Brevibacillus borstelensis]
MLQVVDRIGFFINTPFHYYLYEDTINSLQEKGYTCDLILNDDISHNEEWREMYNGTVEFIENIERDDLEAFPCSVLLLNGIKYNCVVSPYYFSQLSDLGIFNVRMMYGVGFGLEKESWNFSYWNVFYDMILNYGQYDYERTNIFNSGRIIGNPKFDRWFNNQINVDLVLSSMKNYEPSKKTVLYAPTYGEHSSIDQWLDKLELLQKEYNVIVKLHHGTTSLQSEFSRRQKIYSMFDNVRDDRTNTLDLLKIADIVITDTSGMIFDSLLAGKKTIILNTDRSDKYKSKSPEANLLREIVTSYDIGCSLETSLQSIFSEEPLEVDMMQSLIDNFFAFRDGRSSVRAAEAIIDTVQNPKQNILREDLKEKLKL